MLARRFTIVFLLLTLFGMLFSILVAETARSSRSWRMGEVVPCPLKDGLRCLLPERS